MKKGFSQGQHPLNKWTPDYPGFHIVKHMVLKNPKEIPERYDEIIKKEENPVAVIITIVSNPGWEFTHMVKNSKNIKSDRSIILRNILNKHKNTEMIIIEGGANILLTSSSPFKTEE